MFLAFKQEFVVNLIRILPAALLLVAVAASVPALAADGLTPSQKQAVEEVVRDYLKNHPEVLLDAINTLQAREEGAERVRVETAIKEKRAEIERSPGSPEAGNPDGTVTVVEFFDYQCGYCKRILPTMTEVLKSEAKVRWVFKELPILGPDSVIAARAALAAWKQDKGKYLAFHTFLMGNKGPLGEDKIMSFAVEAGIDRERLKRTMADPTIEVELQRTMKLAKVLGINGTPAFVVGNQLVPGAVGLSDLKKLIDAAEAGK